VDRVVTRPRKDDRGVSIVELSVAMTIGALLLGVTASFFIGAMRTVRTVNASTATVADARIATEAVTRTLRVAVKPSSPSTATAIVSAGPTGVKFWALLNRSGAPTTGAPQPTLVEYAYSTSAKCLTESQTPYGGTTRTKCLIRTSIPPAFTYYSTGAAGAAALPASPPDLSAIRSVELSLKVRTPGDPAATTFPVVTRVTLENIPAAGG
jgi:type II secretory pathway component PulJ